MISPTPSPDVDNTDTDRTATETKQPEFSSWKQRQSAEKKELVNRLRETLFKFCEDNLEYSKCLHIRGDVLVIYDDNSLSAEFDKHLHGDEIAKDKRVRSQKEAVRAKNQANKSQERAAPQPIIQSVTSLANLAASTAGSAATTQSAVKPSSASKRAADLDRIIDSWYARPEEGSGGGGSGSNNDSDADSLGKRLCSSVTGNSPPPSRPPPYPRDPDFKQFSEKNSEVFTTVTSGYPQIALGREAKKSEICTSASVAIFFLT